MKRVLFGLFLLPLLVLVSCSGNNPDWREQYKEASYYVVQFEPLAATYKSHVMLTPNSKGEYKMRSLQNGGTCKEFFLFHSPFLQVDSTQQWYLSDWKWGLYLSKAHSVLLLEWRDVRDPDATYVRTDFTPVASGILQRIGMVRRSDIDRLLGIEPAPASATPGSWGRTSGGISTDHLAPVYLSRYYSTQNIPDVIDRKGDWKYTKEDFLAERLRQDSLQEVYRDRLARLYYSGLINQVVKTVE
jgi:hypothetical protein